MIVFSSYERSFSDWSYTYDSWRGAINLGSYPLGRLWRTDRQCRYH